VSGVQRIDGRIEAVPVQVKDAAGALLAAAIPRVTLIKTARYLEDDFAPDPDGEIDLLARIDDNLRSAPLAGFVADGTTPYGGLTPSVSAALERAVCSGMPVVRVAGGTVGGFTPLRRGDLTVSGSNLTATKARMLLMACLMKFGSLPAARDPLHPSQEELTAIRARVADYQDVFNTH